jgi:hypothetical protein
MFEYDLVTITQAPEDVLWGGTSDPLNAWLGSRLTTPNAQLEFSIPGNTLGDSQPGGLGYPLWARKISSKSLLII